MKSLEFVSILKKIQQEIKTVYMWGTFGSPVRKGIVEQKMREYPSFYNKRRLDNLSVLIKEGNYYAFDCVGLIKSVIWGFNFDSTRPYGGAKYASNRLKDIDANVMQKMFISPSRNFKDISVGEAVHMHGHIGVYIGNGKVIECTTDFSNGVCITKLSDRKWTSHGKLVWIDYSDQDSTSKQRWEELIDETKSKNKEEWKRRIKSIIDKKEEPIDKHLGDLLVLIGDRKESK